ncbi:MAG: chorismate synthase, partial [Clostridia bacterium]|nr:chorismate synthase [Clostridia bacterium]
MSKYNGKTLNIEIFGESHSDFIGAKVYGLPRFNYDRGAVEAFMKRRRPKSDISTARRENDDMTIVYAPDGAIEMRIKNGDVKSGDYADLHGKPRPSHADYAAYLK